MVVSKAVVEEKDKFGTERFEVIKAEFAKFKLNKDFARRYERIETLFMYRRGVAHELHHLEDQKEFGWTYHRKILDTQERLNTFKSVQFFLDAFKTLLDEVRKEAVTPKPAPRRRYY
jgi:hypothetical protein